MAGLNIFPSGFSGLYSSGPLLALARQAYLTGHAYFVSQAGVDVAGVDGEGGREPEEPLLTIAQALTNVAAAAAAGTLGTWFVFVAENFTLTQTAVHTVGTAGTHILGLGAGSTRPRITLNGGVIGFNLTGAGCTVENLFFPTSTAAPTSRISASGARPIIKDCYFECGSNDSVTVSLTANQASVLGCTFLSTGTAVTAQPGIGLSIGGAISDLEVEDCTFSGGTYGWNDYAWKMASAVTRLRGRRITTDKYSDIFGVNTTTGYILGRDDVERSIKGKVLLHTS